MSKKSSKKPTEAIQKEDVVQAVVMCDSCNDEFSPLKSIIPTTLLPLVNTALLDYTLEFLAISGVQEVILFCVSHAELIKQHVKGSKWSAANSPMLITTLVSEGCRSLGDAMRDLDAKSVLRGDFFLLSGETVSNVHLLPILEQHKKLQKQDKGAVMTLVYKQAAPGHRIRTPGNEVMLAVDAATSRILYHEKIKQRNKRVELPLEVVMDHASVDLHYDLADTGISVCTTAVPQLFSDNFDFQTRDDFVRGLLLNEEILASTMYCHRLRCAEYAATVDCWPAYQAVTHDIIHRWVYPFVPDLSLREDIPAYMFLRQNVYRQRTAKLAKGCVLEEDVVIADGSTVGQDTKVTRSVIGRNCHIDASVVIKDSFLWDDVTVEANCELTHCVIAHGCVISRGSRLHGCVICPGVRLPRDSALSLAQLVSARLPALDLEFEQVAQGVWQCRPGGDEEEEVAATRGLWVGEEEESGDEGSEVSGSSGDMSDRDSPIPDDTNMFYREVMDSLARGYEDQLACDNLILEINSSRYAYNVSVKEVNFHVVRALLNLPPAEGYFTSLVKQMEYFTPILENYIKRSRDAQMDCLQAIEEVAESKPELRVGVQKLLHLLYDKDLLEENVILSWFNSPDPDLPSSAALRKQVSAFITWLQEADEESSSGE